MERKDLDSLTLAEVQDVLTKSIEDFKVEAEKITSLDVLEEEIKKIDELMKGDKEYIDGVVYNLPDGCDFGDPGTAPTHYKASAVSNKIVYFVNKNEVDWAYTLGLYQMVKFWKSEPKTISYAIYDSTLRLLNQNKFKGFSEWQDILIINEYMSACHELYTKDTNWIMYHSTLMNVLLDRQKLIEKNEGMIDENMVGVEKVPAEN